MKPRHILLGLLVAVPVVCSATNIDRSTLTEVVNKVSVIDSTSRKTSAAQVRSEFVAPNILRTGADSRAEMIAPDQTVTRVGQNTIFSFSRDSREIELEKGSILFQSPSGKGGGTIRTPAASAAVLGTTLIVVATKNGGFKVLLIEGSGKVKAADGTVRTINSGQMVYALPGGKLSGVFEFRLSQQVGASALVSGFKKKLPSTDKIQAAINRQEKDIKSGSAIETGLLASGSPTIAYKVDVARDTIKEQQQSTMAAAQSQRFLDAANTPATIASADLDPARVFVPEDMDQLGFPGDNRPLFGLFGNGLPQRTDSFAQFVGSDILFDTPTVSLDPYAGREAFRFLALNNIEFQQSVDFGTYFGAIQFWAGDTIRTAPGIAVKVSAMASSLSFIAFGQPFSVDQPLPTSLAEIDPNSQLLLSSFTAQNFAGAIGLAGGNVDLEGVRLGAGGPLIVAAGSDLTVRFSASGPFAPLFEGQQASQFDAASELVSGVSADLVAARDIKLNGVLVQAPRIRVQSGNDLQLRAVQLNDTSTPAASGSPSPGGGTAFVPTNKQVFLSAQKLADLRNVNFLSNDVLLQARTIRLEQVNFRDGSRVILESQIGRLAPNPNTGRPAIPGLVNFIKGVKYGDSPAEQFVIQNGPGQTPSSAGIIIRPRGK